MLHTNSKRNIPHDTAVIQTTYIYIFLKELSWKGCLKMRFFFLLVLKSGDTGTLPGLDFKSLSSSFELFITAIPHAPFNLRRVRPL